MAMATKKHAQDEVMELLARLGDDPRALRLVTELIELLASRNRARRTKS